jgi:MinD-like ATPase involved in chromosome partitioning or flagellar assembly
MSRSGRYTQVPPDPGDVSLCRPVAAGPYFGGRAAAQKTTRRALLLAEVVATPSAETRFITVTGGRGGVGKSVVAAQLAWSLAASGRRVLLADLDLGAPSQHLILGVTPPRAGLGVLLASERPIGDALLETRHPNLWLLAGGRSGLPGGGTAHLTAAMRRVLHDRLRRAGADVVVLDVGAGVGYDPLPLFALGHHRLIVASGQAASVHEGFALLKASVLRLFESYLRRAGQLAALEPPVRAREGERMGDLLRRLSASDAQLAETIATALGRFGAALVGNQLPDVAQVGALQAMCRMASEYLGVALPLVGWLRAGARLPDLTGGQRPAVGLAAGQPDESATFRALAEAVLETPICPALDIFGDLEGSLPPPRAVPPPIPAAAQRGPSAAPLAAIVDSPSGALRVKPLVYVRPPRKRRPDAAQRAAAGEPRPAVESAAGPPRTRSRGVTLPGMPPRRNA